MARLKFQLEIELGNEAMQIGDDVIWSIKQSLKGESHLLLGPGVSGRLWDLNGNIVGAWKVVEE